MFVWLIRLGAPTKRRIVRNAAPSHVAPRRLPVLNGTRLRAGHVRPVIFRAFERVP